MGGRVTLVNAVLNAIGVHAMMVLPVPRTVLSRLVSMMASFVWDRGAEKRRHWISWERMCCSKKFGGLGLRDPKLVMQSLHGKLAWKYLIGDSIWARYARSRFQEGRRGSPLWNNIVKLLPQVRSLGYWKFSKGDTRISAICAMIGGEPTSNLADDPIREVLENPGQRFSFMQIIPQVARGDFENVVFNESGDEFRCKHNEDGRFHTKVFYEARQIRYGIRSSWGRRIWKPWIPPKISCFLWKLMHGVTPTDDNIVKLGIPLASRCSCCSSPQVESASHLFFSGELAVECWRRLGDIFDRPRISGLGAFNRVWLQGDKKNYMDSIATLTAVCAIWEIWKFRNEKIFKATTRLWWRSICSLAAKFSATIRARYITSMRNDLVMSVLRIPRPRQGVRARGEEWRPPDRTSEATDSARDDVSIPIRDRFPYRPFIDDSHI